MFWIALWHLRSLERYTRWLPFLDKYFQFSTFPITSFFRILATRDKSINPSTRGIKIEWLMLSRSQHQERTTIVSSRYGDFVTPVTGSTPKSLIRAG